MANAIQFGDFNKAGDGRNQVCLACEDFLADALDETLSTPDRAFFDKHLAECADCRQMLAEAQCGAAWLGLLKTPRPEPSAALLETILAQTSGPGFGKTTIVSHVADVGEQVAAFGPPAGTRMPSSMPLSSPAPLLLFPAKPATLRVRQPNGFEPRLILTAAMAFFSIALTLNLTGFRLEQLHNLGARNLRPATLERTFYAANAQAARFYDSLRVVQVVQSRIGTLRDTTDDGATPDTPPARTPQQQPPPSAQPQPQGKPAEPKKTAQDNGVSQIRRTPSPSSGGPGRSSGSKASSTPDAGVAPTPNQFRDLGGLA